MDRPPTPVATLRRVSEIRMEEGLHYVYEDNVIGEKGGGAFKGIKLLLCDNPLPLRKKSK